MCLFPFTSFTIYHYFLSTYLDINTALQEVFIVLFFYSFLYLCLDTILILVLGQESLIYESNDSSNWLGIFDI